MFFSEEKNQKTFANCCMRIGGNFPRQGLQSGAKVFLLLFLQKKKNPCLSAAG